MPGHSSVDWCKRAPSRLQFPSLSFYDDDCFCNLQWSIFLVHDHLAETSTQTPDSFQIPSLFLTAFSWELGGFALTIYSLLRCHSFHQSWARCSYTAPQFFHFLFLCKVSSSPYCEEIGEDMFVLSMCSISKLNRKYKWPTFVSLQDHTLVRSVTVKIEQKPNSKLLWSVFTRIALNPYRMWSNLSKTFKLANITFRALSVFLGMWYLTSQNSS